MEIIKSTENLTSVELYQLTKNPVREPIKNHPDEVLDIVAYAMYKDVNSKGEDIKLMSLMDKNGVVYTTNSATAMKDMQDILDVGIEPKKDVPIAIGVRSGTSNSGRTFFGLFLAAYVDYIGEAEEV